MQPYQNYFQPQMQTQGYQNYNPYMQRMENLQQFQQMIQTPVLQPTQMSGATFSPFGKIVENIDMVKVTDIPMDGNMYYFPKTDGTEIYGKQFMVNGQTRILTFKPILDDNTDNSANTSEKAKIELLEQFTETFNEKISVINDKIDKIEKYLKPAKVKKEVDSDV